MKEVLATVLAAGRGTRLASVGEPKVMVGLHERPMLAYSLRTILELNLDELVVVTGHKAEVVERYFGNLHYQRQKILNGNAGALKVGFENARARFKSVLVVQGDDSAFYLPKTLSSLCSLHENARADVTLLLTNEFDEDTHKSQFVLEANGRIKRYKKGRLDPRGGLFFTGIACFAWEFLSENLSRLKAGSNGEIEIPQLFELALKESKRVFALCAPEGEWVGINTPKELCRARRQMAERVSGG
jgi:bifunctional N-acetylglucosamine-1-phosphate-uridyltransferase/glucosamine-1-phosphate-acetyltransferase GlmU-like protein